MIASSALMLLCLAGARASMETSAGFEIATGNPYLRSRGLALGADYRPRRMLRLGIFAVRYIYTREEPGWTPLTEQLVAENHVSPDLTRMVWRARAVVGFDPFRTGIGSLDARTGLHVGFGAAKTRDDLEALQQQDDPDAQATETQLQPTMVYGLSSSLGGERLRGRLVVERVRFTETVSSTTVENQSYLAFRLEAVYAFGGDDAGAEEP